jgi:hypothetical protein
MTAKHDIESRHAAPAPTIGCDVFTIEGLPAGKVAALSGRFMRVDAPMRRDYWLHVDDIVSIEGGAVTLAYPRDAIEEHKLSVPAASEADLVFDVEADPVLLGEEEQVAQRARMERELEEQRRRLAGRAASPPQTTTWEPLEQPAEPEPSKRPFLRRCVPCLVGAVALAAIILMMRRRRRRRHREPEPAVPEA